MSSSIDQTGFLSAKKRALLEQRLKQKGISTLKTPLLIRRSEADICPLSFAQRRLWFFDQLDPNSNVYLIPMALRLDGPLREKALEQSLIAMVQRHESLRTLFRMHEEQPIQVICQPPALCLPFIDLQEISAQEYESEARRLAGQEARQPCNLQRGPLFRATLLALAPQRYILLLTMHHIISDRWSNDIFLRDLTILYRSYVEGKPAPLAPLPIQYADYALWQHQFLKGEIIETQISYWKRHMAGVALLELPTDHPRPRRQTFHGAVETSFLPARLREKLTELAQRERVTLFMLLLTAFQVLLSRYSGQDDICVGTAVANRIRPELENLIGFFINTLPLRINLTGVHTFLDALKQVREMALQAYAHQDIPFEHLVEVLQPERDLSRPPLFQVTFRLQQAQQKIEAPQELHIHSFGSDEFTTKFEMSVVVTEIGDGLSCGIQYNTDLFEAATMRRMLDHWQILLEGIVAAPQTSLPDLPLLTQVEQQRLLKDWNATTLPLPIEQCVHTSIELQARQTPDAIALVTSNACLSYSALLRLARQLAGLLLRQNIAAQSPIAHYMQPSIEGAIALIATFMVRGIYVPLAIDAPPDRLNWQLTETKPAIVITQKHLEQKLPATDVPVFSLEDLWSSMKQEQSIAQQKSWPEDLAYILYTSGSTGKPKGVMISHRAIANRLWWGNTDIQTHMSDRVVQLASWSFDIALWELLGPLMVGATVVLTESATIHESRALSAHFYEQNITVAHMVPSLLTVVIQEATLARCQHLRCIQCGGEAVNAELVRKVQAILPIPVHQYYGPTETSISVTCWIGLTQEDTEQISIGRPIANTQIYLTDRYGQLVPQGMRGEIWIGGIGVAEGYTQQPEMTAERFIPDPFSGAYGARLYRTGDLARYRSSGELEFSGRRDRQVKIRGHRIEPGEIEAVLLQHPLIGECSVEARTSQSEELQLIAYITCKVTEQHALSDLLRRYLLERLPDYMVPAFFVLLEALPLTSNGKIDRKALPEPDYNPEQADEEGSQKHTPIIELLVTIWCEILGRPHIGIHENFFEVGGHSLLLTRLIARVQAVLEVDIPLSVLFESPSIAEMAERIEILLRGGHEMAAPPLIAATRTQDLPLSFAQQRLWFLDQLEPGNTAYLIPSARRLYGPLQLRILELSLHTLLQRHESLRTTFQSRSGLPIQIIHRTRTAYLPVIDLSSLNASTREQQARRLLRQEVSRPCDLIHGPLLRTSVLRMEPQEHVFFTTMHHIISDGWSDMIFLRELTALYRAFEDGSPSPLAPLSIQYADYALWQRQWLSGKVLDDHLAYWKRQLAGARPCTLPTSIPRPANPGYQGASYNFTLPAQLVQEVTRISQQKGATPFMVLLAAFQTLLYLWTGQTDIVVGTDVANRTHMETETLIGFFVNLLVLRTHLNGAPSFHNLLYRVREMILQAYSHQEVPFEMLVEHLRLERRISQTPLVHVLFVLQNIPGHPQPLPDMRIQPLTSGITTAKFDLALFLHETPQGLHGTAVYKTALFEHHMIATYLGRYEALLRNLLARPDVSIDVLNSLTAEKEPGLPQEMQKSYQFNTHNLRTVKGKEIDLL